MLIVMMVLSGCGGDVSERELKTYINTLKARAAAKEGVKIKPIIWQLPTPVTYKPNGYTISTSTSTANLNVSNPLNACPLSALKFVGTLMEDNEISAYIMTPDNMVYLVKTGDAIGEEYDKIIKIDDRHLVIDKKTLTGMEEVVMELKE